MFDKFRKGAQKAGVQATSFVQRSSTQVASGAQGFAQTFNLPGESEKAANILSSFLGTRRPRTYRFLASLTQLLKQIQRTLRQRSTRSLNQSYNKHEACSSIVHTQYE